MYEGYKFNKIEKIILYSIAVKRNPVKIEEIYNTFREIKKGLIDSTIRKLKKENLIKKERYSNILVLNTGKRAMEKIKKMLENHWETNWEADWKDVTK